MIKDEWRRLGGSAVTEETHQAQEANFRPMLLKMMAEKPDAIYITSSLGKQAAQIVRQATDLGYEGYFLSYGALEDPEVLALGAKAEKCIYTAPTFDTASSDPTTKSFVSAFTAKYGRPPNVHQANHYDLIKIIETVSSSIEKSGKRTTGALFKEAFTAQFPEYVGAAGKYRFSFKDGSVLRSTVVKTVKNGAFTKIADLA